MKTYNYRSLAAEAGISAYILRAERKKLFAKHPELKERFGSYEHNVLTAEQVKILVEHVPLLRHLDR